MQGRMNSMQKSMLQWNELYPYSAVHIVQLGGKLDAARMQGSINDTVTKHGLNRLRLDSKSFSFEYEGGPANCQIQMINGGEQIRRALVADIERQLNLPFDHTQTFTPFRFLIAAAGDSFFLGVVYFHPMADAESVA